MSRCCSFFPNEAEIGNVADEQHQNSIQNLEKFYLKNCVELAFIVVKKAKLKKTVFINSNDYM